MSSELIARMALTKHGFTFTHSLGQNFLLDERIIDAIVAAADVRPDERVLEIGAGSGILTRAMTDAGAQVVAMEIDRTLAPVLADVVGDRAKIVFSDICKSDLSTLSREFFDGAPFRVVANLPYYITADALELLTGSGTPVTDIVLMVQKEAAARVMAAPGKKEYCALAAQTRYFGLPEILLDVPPEAFTPRPHVESVLMHIPRYTRHPCPAKDEALLRRVIASAFRMRRKTLANNLSASFALSRADAQAVIMQSGFDERVRGETLAIEDFVRLSTLLAEKLNA